jgi:FAD dependent monooxygenase
MPNLEPGSMTSTRDLGCSSLLFVAKDRVPQWFFISKMDKLYRGNSIPRYTESDMESTLSTNKDFQLAPGVALKDLIASATQISYQALEEAHHNVWTYDRIICLGDSIHKMTPNVSAVLTAAACIDVS